MRHLWIKAAALVAIVWLLAGAVVWLVRHSQPTPESVALYLAAHPLTDLSGSARTKVIHSVASQMNALSYEDRQGLRSTRKPDAFFHTMTPAEQEEFLDLTLPAGFKQMMEALNRMDPEKRKQVLDRALADMKKHEGEERPERPDPNAQKIMQEGLRSFYSEANAAVKMDVAPLIEQLQKNMEGYR